MLANWLGIYDEDCSSPLLSSTETSAERKFATAKSRLPSPLKSAATSPYGFRSSYGVYHRGRSRIG